jgi:short-subunit dehydrogenase
MKLQDKKVVITGGGAGIGRFLALAALKKGAKVAICDINEEYLEETAALISNTSNLTLHVCDITNKEQVNELPNEIIEKLEGIDILINNAGIIQPFTSIEHLDEAVIRKMMEVNYFGTINMIKSFLPHLRKRDKAQIINIGSMGGFIPFPGQTAYCASKAAIKLLTEGMNVELMGTNIKMTLIQPGGIATEITKNSGIEISNKSEKEQSYSLLSPEKAAEQIIVAIEKERFRVFIGKDAKMLNFLYRFFPTWISKKIAIKMKS